MADFVGMMAMCENGGDIPVTRNDGIQINMRRGVWQYALFPSRTNVGGVHCMGVCHTPVRDGEFCGDDGGVRKMGAIIPAPAKIIAILP